MGTLARILLIFIIIYYLFRLIGRYLFPFLLKNQVEKMQKKQEQARKDFENKQRSEEGKVTIDYNSRKDKNKRDSDSQGEYVDYEEIK
ncbi:DUF4834 family protein [Marinilabilia salmonicolor]|uniref:DUF4834 family protein n=1 Tax=Marinilabilia salmonicolor TaxID=989 RepID=UPI00029ADD1E|nr:DUF4834 family protein [Marinilabilia salmonicolor]